MDKVTPTEIAVAEARKAERLQLLLILKDCKSLQEAEEKVKALLK